MPLPLLAMRVIAGGAAFFIGAKVVNKHGFLGYGGLKTEISDEDRYYSHFDPFPFEPTRKKFKIFEAENSLGGIKSLVDFETEDIVFIFSGEIQNTRTDHTIQVGPEEHLKDGIFTDKLLHSCSPNLACDVEKRIFKAIRPIKSGDLLTRDYESTEEELINPFFCKCGSEKCRGFIKGRNF